MTDRDYQHSRILDVHRWSEHQEANLFVDEVYDTFLNRQEPEIARIKEKHLTPNGWLDCPYSAGEDQASNPKDVM